MKFSRTLALLAIPAALSLAACGGGSTGVSNAVGLQSQLRFVNGATDPSGASVDIFFTSSGTQAATGALVPALSYGSITDFGVQPVTAAQILIHTANSPTILGSCNIPQPANNEKDTVVIVNSGNATAPLTCTEFKDFDYTAPGQYRFHHAAAVAAAATPSFSFGVTGGVPSATFTAAGAAAFPGSFAANPGFAVGSAGPNGPVTAGPATGFAIGANAQAGTTVTTIAQMNVSQAIAPSPFPGMSASQTDTANTLPGGGFNNASIFIIDCNGATTPQGTACVGGVALIGSFDTK
jgi:hypothetical protein